MAEGVVSNGRFYGKRIVRNRIADFLGEKLFVRKIDKTAAETLNIIVTFHQKNGKRIKCHCDILSEAKIGTRSGQKLPYDLLGTTNFKKVSSGGSKEANAYPPVPVKTKTKLMECVES